MKERIISTIFMLIIFIPILLMGNWPFYILFLILSLIALHELLKLTNKIPIFMKLISYLLTGFLVYQSFNSKILNINLSISLLITFLLIYLVFLVFINNQDKYNYKDAFYLFAITLFIGISFGNIIRIRNLNINILIYLLLIAVCNDTFALFTGKLLGKHKLAPLISPNKTIEGALGGSVIATIVAVLYYLNYLNEINNIYILIIFTFFLTIVAILGDLIKSSIKRYEKIKDFSNLIPGHGGVLDRLDSIIFVSMTYILISILL